MATSTVIYYDYYVYLLSRLNGVPFYVGMGRGRRWLQHEGQAKRGERSHKAHIIRKILREASEIPKKKIAEGLTFGEAIAMEINFIARIGRRPHGPLVNATPGGEGRSEPISAEHKAKIGAANRGKRHTDEYRARMSARFKGRKIPQEAVEKVRAALKGRKQSPELVEKRRQALLGKRRTPEQRAASSAARKGKPLAPHATANAAIVNRGKPRSAETRAKISAGQKARPPRSDEEIARLRALATAMRGTTRPQETKDRIAETMRKRRREHKDLGLRWGGNR
jgi:hypothetical protein